MPSELDTWLALTPEAAIEPELVICDPHQHLWVRRGYEPYLAEQFVADTTAGHRVETTVYVECGSGYRTEGPEELRVVGESEFAARQAAEVLALGGPRIAGIVGTADLTLGDRLDDVLDAHEAAAAGRFRGIRDRVIHDPTRSAFGSEVPQPDPYRMADPAFRVGAARLGARGLSLDVWIFHVQLEEIVDLARAVPETTMVLNHLGGPIGVGAYKAHRDEEHARWRARMAEVAGCPNVVLKVGGHGMRMFGTGWVGAVRPPTSDEVVALWGDGMRFVIDAFGPSRCMFESNFPVDRMSFSYVVLWNAFKKVSAGFSAAERDDLMRGTATRTYRL